MTRRVLIAVLLVSILAGCSARTRVNVDGGAVASPAAGTAATSSSVEVRVRHSSLAAALIALSLLAGAIEYSREERPFPGFSTFSDWMHGAPAPELAADRSVTEHDCTKPIAELSGNLKCR